MTDKNVLIFRKYLLAYSETFIADQGRYLVDYRSTYTGLVRDAQGISLLSDMPSFVLEDFTQNIKLSKLAYRLGFFSKKWIDEILTMRPDVIHAHFLNDGLDALRLKNRLNIPLVTSLHGHDITKNEKTKILQKSRRGFFGKVDKIIAVSDFIYQKAVENGCPEDKLIKHSIGIDLEKFTQEKQESEQPEILFVGRLTEIKGCAYLLKAMAVLKKKYPELRLTVVGGGPLLEALKDEVKQKSLNVEFVGVESAEKIRDRLAKAWLFAGPSISMDNGYAEGLGMVFLEAQALKTPVVSFASGGVVEAIEDGVSGVLSREKDVQELAESIEYFLESKERRQQFGEEGRQRVEALFDIRKQCLLLEKIYDNIR